MSPELVVSIGGLVASAGAAAVAWWQALEAKQRQDAAETAQGRAEKARDLALEYAEKSAAEAARQADALNEANRIAADAARPRHWNIRGRIDSLRYESINTSGKNMRILHIDTQPEVSAGQVNLVNRAVPPFDLLAGATLRYWLAAPEHPSLEPDVVEVRWHFEGEQDIYSVNFPIV